MFRTNLFNAIENAFKTQDSNTKSTWEIAGLNLPLPVWRRSSTELSRSVVINPLSWKNGKSERSSTRCKIERKRMIYLRIVPWRDFFWISAISVYLKGLCRRPEPDPFLVFAGPPVCFLRTVTSHEWFLLLRDSCLYCYFSKAICLSVCLWGLSECRQSYRHNVSECRQSHRHNDWTRIVCHSIH